MMLLVDFQLPAKSKHGGKDKLVHKALAQKAVAQLVAPHFPQRPILKALNSLLSSCPPFNTRTLTYIFLTPCYDCVTYFHSRKD